MVALVAMCSVLPTWSQDRDYLCFTMNGGVTGLASAKVELVAYNNPYSISLEYSENGIDGWKTFVLGSGSGKGVRVYKGNSVYLRAKGSNENFSKDDQNFYYFKFSDISLEPGAADVSGNIMSLLDSKCLRTDVPEYAFYRLFGGTGADVFHSAPELPATQLMPHCYEKMFYGASTLNSAPELPATELEEGCYNSMFEGCESIKYLKVGFSDWNAKNSSGEPVAATTNWVKGVTSTGGLFYCPLDLTPLTNDINHIPVNWKKGNKPNVEHVSDANDYLFFEAKKTNSTIQLNRSDKSLSTLTGKIEYDLEDGNGWQTYTWTKNSTSGLSITLNRKKGVYRVKFRRVEGDNSYVFSSSTADYYYFTMKGEIEASGNIMSLLSYDCTAVKSVKPYTFYKLFINCTSLENNAKFTIMKIPATTLAAHCYESMFEGCTKLDAAPALNAPEMAESCYANMFKGCTKLVSAPILPSTVLATSCYEGMFYNCSSMIEAPKLPATYLHANCYKDMFRGCSSLMSIKVSFNDWDDNTSDTNNSPFTQDWVTGVTTSGGTFYHPADFEETTTPEGSRIPTNWGGIASGGSTDYLCFTAVGNGNRTIRLTRTTAANSDQYYDDADDHFRFEYSFNPSNTRSWTPYVIGNTITINTQDKMSVYIRCKERTVNGASVTTNPALGKNGSSFMYFALGGGEVASSGNVMSLISSTCVSDSVPDNAFLALFMNQANLIEAPSLLGVVLGKNCYRYMFEYCRNLKKAPELNSTLLADNCYNYMFLECTKLESAPVLPAKNLPSNCYSSMFSNCSSLTTAPEIAATTIGSNSCNAMFQGCKSLSYIRINAPLNQFGSGKTTNWVADGTNPFPDHGVIFAPNIDAKTLTDANFGPNLLPKNSANKWLVNPDCLRFSAENGATIRLNKEGSPAAVLYLEYSTDNTQSWKTYGWTGSTGAEIKIKAGQSVYIRATVEGGNTYKENSTFSTDYQNYYKFVIDGSVDCEGEITSLLKADGSVTSLAGKNSVFTHLFDGCTGLKSAPSLSATVLSDSCYSSMFKGCSSLSIAPTLRAETMSKGAYRNMFQNCKVLPAAPELPATTLAEDCYKRMFMGCSSLVLAPSFDLTSDKLASGCYEEMFVNCSSLNNLNVKFDSWGANGNQYTKNWVQGVASTGVFMGPDALPHAKPGNYNVNNIPVGWDFNPKYLCFTALEPVDLALNKVGNPNDVSLEFLSTTKMSWITYTWNGDGAGRILSLKAGDKVYFRSKTIPDNGHAFSKSATEYYNFRMTGGQVLASGKVGYLVKGNYNDGYLNNRNYTFFGLFKDCESLITTPELPANENVGEGMFQSMFEGTGITSTPALPKGNAENSTFKAMFKNCKALKTVTPFNNYPGNGVSCFESMFEGSGLETAPSLPTGNCGTASYRAMFKNCKSLTSATDIQVSQLANYCFESMFEGCDQLVNAPRINKLNISDGCFKNMFKDCVKLETTPDLDMGGIQPYCYEGMFSGCVQLDTPPTLPSSSVANYCYKDMFNGCKELDFCPTLLATSLSEGCYEGMFAGCTGISAAPSLPATSLASKCYKNMFNGCTKLSYINVAFNNWDATENENNATYHWVENVAPKGTFQGGQNLDLSKVDESHVPFGWITDAPDYLCFVAREGWKTVGIAKEGTPADVTFYYKKNTESSWTKYTQAVQLDGIGEYILFRGESASGLFNSTSGYYQVKLSGKFDAQGSVTSLLDASCERTDVPAYAYRRLFYECSNLMSAPKVPAGTLAEGCYKEMFAKCTNLVDAPALPSKELKKDCYSHMFDGCSNLSSMNVGFDDWKQFDGVEATDFWLNGVASNGVFTGPKLLVEDHYKAGVSYIPGPWSTDSPVCFSLKAIWNSGTIAINHVGGTEVAPLMYSRDGGSSWTNYTGPISVGDGEVITFASNNYKGKFSYSESDYYQFELTGDFEASGNIMSLLDQTCAQKTVPACAFYGLFMGCDNLYTAPELPATTVNRASYAHMFDGCTSLKTAPALPAATIAESCYEAMFKDCSALVDAPALPATETVTNCYDNMFENCSSLMSMSVGFNDWKGGNNTTDWVKGVTTSGGTFTASGLASEHDDSHIPVYWGEPVAPDYFKMTVSQDNTYIKWVSSTKLLKYSTDDGRNWYDFHKDGQIQLNKNKTVLFKANGSSNTFNTLVNKYQFTISAPVKLSGNIMSLIDPTCGSLEVPAHAFDQLFKGLTNITDASELKLPATKLGTYCYASMFENCTGLTKAPELPATVLSEGCYSRMFAGCTSLENGFELPASTLKKSCYKQMFYGSAQIAHTLKVGFTAWEVSGLAAADQPTYQWVGTWGDTETSGSFICSDDLDDKETTGASRIPRGWVAIASPERSTSEYLVVKAGDVNSLKETVAYASSLANAIHRVKVFVPQGDYLMENEGLAIKGNVSLIGENAGNTRIASAASPAVLQISGDDNYVQDLTLISTGASPAILDEGGNRNIVCYSSLSANHDVYVARVGSSQRNYVRACDISMSSTGDLLSGSGTVWFENCNLNLGSSGSNVVASSTPAGSAYGFVFDGCTVKGGAANYSIARPIAGSPAVMWKNNCHLSANASADGYGEGTPDLTVRFYEQDGWAIGHDYAACRASNKSNCAMCQGVGATYYSTSGESWSNNMRTQSFAVTNCANCGGDGAKYDISVTWNYEDVKKYMPAYLNEGKGNGVIYDSPCITESTSVKPSQFTYNNVLGSDWKDSNDAVKTPKQLSDLKEVTEAYLNGSVLSVQTPGEGTFLYEAKRGGSTNFSVTTSPVVRAELDLNEYSFSARVANDRGGFGHTPKYPTDVPDAPAVEPYVITLNDYGYATFSYSSDVRLIGGAAFLAELIDNEVELHHINAYDVIPAGKGVIIFGDPKKDGVKAKVYAYPYTGPADVNNKDDYNSGIPYDAEHNQLKGHTGASVKASVIKDNNSTYKALYGLSGYTIRRLGNDATIGQYKAYMALENDGAIHAGASAARGMLFRNLFTDDEESEEEETVTVVENLNEEDALGSTIYDMNGRKTSSKKGLVVRNGKVEFYQ